MVEGRVVGPMRTFCVIPHQARQCTSFFEGVYEDGVRITHHHQPQSLLFSHVLSPAHDLVKHVNGPILAALRAGESATLVIAAPSAEEDMQQHLSTAEDNAQLKSSGPDQPILDVGHPLKWQHRNSGNQPTAPTLASQASTLLDASEVALELYTQLFPLLFRNLPACSSARLSMVTVSASDRILLDHLAGNRRLRNVGEAKWTYISRDASASAWGGVLHCLKERHEIMEQSASALESQTACVVRVEFDDCPHRLVVVDVSSEQELLQQLTLIFGMSSGTKTSRATPPRTPLRALLDGHVAAETVAQLVCIAAPQNALKHTLRVLRFAAEVEAMQCVEAEAKAASHSSESIHAVSTTPSQPVLPRQRGGAAGLSSSRNGGPAAALLPSSSKALPASLTTETIISTAVTPSLPSSQDAASRLEQTPSVLPQSTLAPVNGDQQLGREKFLMQRIALLEKQVQGVTEDAQQAEASRAVLQQRLESVQGELKGKLDLWRDLQRTHDRVKKEREDYATVVPKLLRKITLLEKKSAAHQETAVSAARKEMQQQQTVKTLEETIEALRRQVLHYQRCETRRVRQATLSRIIPSMKPPANQPAGSTTTQQTAPHPSSSTTPLGRRVDEVEKSNIQGQLQQGQSAAIADLQRRNSDLEQQVRDLTGQLSDVVCGMEKKPLSPVPLNATSNNGNVSFDVAATFCSSCELMRERVQYYAEELRYMRAEREKLLGILAKEPPPILLQPAEPSKPPNAVQSSAKSNCRADGTSTINPSEQPVALPFSSTDIAQRLTASLLAGCASLHMQLSCIAATLEQRMVTSRHLRQQPSLSATSIDPQSSLSLNMVEEHQNALDGLVGALQKIATKQAFANASLGPAKAPSYQGQPFPLQPIPHTATAADASTLVSYLTYEAERCRHLRAFIPTFTQLAVATEHLKMRLQVSPATLSAEDPQ